MISKCLLQRPQLVWLLVVATLVAGIGSYNLLLRLEDPVLVPRVGVIDVALPGASASEIESTVTIPLERLLREIPEIKQLRSNTRSDVTNLVIELDDRVTDTDTVWATVRRTLQTSDQVLPQTVSRPSLTVFPLRAYAAILAIVPLEGQTSALQTSRLADELQAQLLNMPGTQSVEIFGGLSERLTVRIKPQTLFQTGLSATTIAQQITAYQSVPSGNMLAGGATVAVEVPETLSLQQRMENLPIQLPGPQQPVRLAELATIAREPFQSVEQAAIVDGRDAVVLAVLTDEQTRIDFWSERLQRNLIKFTNRFPGDYQIQPLFLQNDHLQQRMNNLWQNLLVSGIAVTTIVFLFMGWRCMLVVAVSLPLSACLVVCGLRLFAIPLHQMSVTGLIVALGLLIDNAIVMVEEVRRKIYQGQTATDAIANSVRHLRIPLLGSTLTTILAFLPIATMPGAAGEFVGSLAVSVILAVSASLLLSITIIPPMVLLLGVRAGRTSIFDYGLKLGFLQQLYRRSLVTVFKFPVLGVAAGITLPVAGFCIVGELPRSFFPATDRNQIQIEIELPPASTVETVRETVDKVSSLMADHQHIQHQHWFIGRSAPTFYYNVVPRRRQSPSYAQAMVELKGDYVINDLVNELQSMLDARILAARVNVRKLQQGPPFDAPVEIRLMGDDIRQLTMLGNQVRQILSEQPDVVHTRSDLGNTVTKLQMVTNEALTQQLGVSRETISRSIYDKLQGASAGSFFESGVETPVHVEVDFSNRSIVDSLLSMTLAVEKNRRDASVTKNANAPPLTTSPSKPLRFPLGSVGQFELAADAGAIVRLNGKRMNEVKAYLPAGILPVEAMNRFKKALAASDFVLPSQCSIEYGGENEQRTQAIETLVTNAIAIIAILVFTLVAITGSIRLAVIVAVVGGAAIGLGPLALYCFGYPLGFMAIVGTMGLLGIAINDTIVVLAAITANRESAQPDLATAPDRSDSPANHHGCSAEQMATVVFGCTRHILATTVTTAIGFLPLVIDGGQFWPPLAIVISAGISGATLLALYAAPSLCLLTGNRVSTEIEKS